LNDELKVKTMKKTTKKASSKKTVSKIAKRSSKTVKKVDVDGTDKITDEEFINSEGGNKSFRTKLSKFFKEKNIAVAVLEPGYFDKGVKRFGKKKDGYAVVYDIDKTAEAIAEDYMKSNKDDKDYTFDRAMEDAYDWLDYNTIRGIPYMKTDGLIAPIVVYTDENGKEQMA